MNHRFFAYLIRWSPNGKRTIVHGAAEENGMEGLFLGDALARNLVRLNDEAGPGLGAMVTGQQAYCRSGRCGPFRCPRNECRHPRSSAFNRRWSKQVCLLARLYTRSGSCGKTIDVLGGNQSTGHRRQQVREKTYIWKGRQNLKTDTLG